jgi:hypothetical protein
MLRQRALEFALPLRAAPNTPIGVSVLRCLCPSGCRGLTGDLATPLAAELVCSRTATHLATFSSEFRALCWRHCFHTDLTSNFPA